MSNLYDRNKKEGEKEPSLCGNIKMRQRDDANDVCERKRRVRVARDELSLIIPDDWKNAWYIAKAVMPYY